MSAAKGTGSKGAIVATAKKVLAKLKNIEKVEMEFIESGAYSSLPTEADEQIEETRETVEENERLLEEISEAVDDNKELIEETEVDDESNAAPVELFDGESEELARTTVAVDKVVDKVEDKATEKSSSKPEKDIFTELEKILKKIIPDSSVDEREDRHNKKSKNREIGGMIDIVL